MTTANAPSTVKADLEFLVNEIRILHTQWDCFYEIFVAPGRSTLHDTGRHLCEVLHLALATEVLMTISRLCDPAQTMGRDNLVFKKFLDDHPSLRPKLGAEIDELDMLYRAELKPHRNRRLAHNDLGSARGIEVINSPKVKAIQRAIELCTDIVTITYAELEHAAISMVPSHVPGEVTWIEAALRLVDTDRLKIKEHHEAVRAERHGS
jgi:hypothetical protein